MIRPVVSAAQVSAALSLSLDEAYLDVTENLKGIPTAVRVATEIRVRIQEQTSLTASAGISYNQFLAKPASNQRKPNGAVRHHPCDEQTVSV